MSIYSFVRMSVSFLAYYSDKICSGRVFLYTKNNLHHMNTCLYSRVDMLFPPHSTMAEIPRCFLKFVIAIFISA